MQPTYEPRSPRSSEVRVFGDDVADPDAPARLEDSRDLGQHGRLVDRQVDDAVGDHDIDRVCRQRICSITPLRKCAFAIPASRAFCWASASISSVMSSP